MKLTETKLKKIIKEEIKSILESWIDHPASIPKPKDVEFGDYDALINWIETSDFMKQVAENRMQDSLKYIKAEIENVPNSQFISGWAKGKTGGRCEFMMNFSNKNKSKLDISYNH
jgi:hypothetical protein